MRDLLITCIIFGSIPLIMVRPHIGIMMWTWISLMNPHRLGWSFVSELPVAMIIGVVTIGSWLLSKEQKTPPWQAISITLLVFWAWTILTTIFGLSPEDAWEMNKKFSKILLMTFITMCLINSESRLRALIWVTAMSIGYYGIRGGVFTLLTGGQYLVWGPANSFIEDNNAMAMATLMVMPLIYYLGVTSINKWVRWGMYAIVVLCTISVIGSYSRGALVGLAAGGLIFWLRSNRRMLIAAVMVVAIAGALPQMPEKWFDRMNTIKTYDKDDSAQQRLHMWKYALNVATDRPIVGGGWGIIENTRFYHIYKGYYRNGQPYSRASHSIYFDILGAHGFPGITLFLTLLIVGWRASSWVRKRTNNLPQFVSEHRLAGFLQVSLVIFGASGAFLSLSTFDLYYLILAIILINKVQVSNKLGDFLPSHDRRGAVRHHVVAG